MLIESLPNQLIDSIAVSLAPSDTSDDHSSTLHTSQHTDTQILNHSLTITPHSLPPSHVCAERQACSMMAGGTGGWKHLVTAGGAKHDPLSLCCSEPDDAETAKYTPTCPYNTCIHTHTLVSHSLSCLSLSGTHTDVSRCSMNVHKRTQNIQIHTIRQSYPRTHMTHMYHT